MPTEALLWEVARRSHPVPVHWAAVETGVVQLFDVSTRKPSILPPSV